jgi:hypothetical protein
MYTAHEQKGAKKTEDKLADSHMIKALALHQPYGL